MIVAATDSLLNIQPDGIDEILPETIFQAMSIAVLHFYAAVNVPFGIADPSVAQDKRRADISSKCGSTSCLRLLNRALLHGCSAVDRIQHGWLSGSIMKSNDRIDYNGKLRRLIAILLDVVDKKKRLSYRLQQHSLADLVE